VALERTRAIARATAGRTIDVVNGLEGAMRAAGLPVPDELPAPAQGALASLVTSVSVPERDFRPVVRDTSPDEDRWLATLPVKVAKRMAPMVRNGLLRSVPAAMAAGRNPFPADRNAFLNLGMDRLMAEGRVSKAQLRSVFQTAYAWTEGTAFSHVAVATKVFHALGLIEDRDNVLILSRKQTATMNP
jgi:hypothetical protein